MPPPSDTSVIAELPNTLSARASASGSRARNAIARRAAWRAWVLPVALLAVWFIVVPDSLAPHGIAVSPAQVWRTGVEQVRSGALARALSASLAREFTGFAIGAALGLLLGVSIGISKWTDRVISPSFNAFKQVSLFAWIPLISVWFGLGDAAKVVFLSLAALVPVAVHTADGIRAIPVEQREVARVFRYRPWQTMVYVVLPSASSSIFTGIYLALIYSWLATLGAEYLLVAGSGIGNLLVDGSEHFRMDMVLFGVLVVGVIGALLNAIARFIQRRFAWQHPTSSQP
ncbi:ABC transporter permease [Robbsia andropogonis]|uniref:ABC transporter permease n=1 Tax=Robbsia andropogonis TaxID=28092 RepID=UPI0004B83E05|nr:ABC transporter permease [Robbsia andropogonis]MCP1120711.1 ABC transporter permease [Robbsia andropogonis]MCP1130445.1 ABC transporter permease [Robbsia andropogonis]